jgi:hypothetical protein
VPERLRVVVPGAPFRRRLAARIVATVAVDEQETAEALSVQRLEQLRDDSTIGVGAERRAAGVRGEVGGDPIRQRRHDGHAKRLGRLDRDALGEDHVDGEREVRVLLDRSERKDDPVVVSQVVLELHPVAVLHPHGDTSS